MVAGAAVNTYYHTRFTSIVVAQTVKEPTPAKLWDKTEKYTVDDGCLAGAALGFVAFLPTLFMRRPSVSWWARCVGMTNIGACTGVVASHAYFQYTGERQKAMEVLEQQRQRRTLEFHHLFWDKLLMAKFDLPIQQYVRHNGIFRAYHLPAEVYDAPEKFGLSPPATTESNATTESPGAAEKTPDDRYYTAAPDHAQHLRNLSIESIQNEVKGCEREKQAALKEAAYMAYEISRKQYEFCHADFPTEEDRQTRMRELQLMNVAFNRLRASADELDRRVLIGKNWLRQITAWNSDDARSGWLATSTLCDPETHDPSLSIAEMRKFQDQLTDEIRRFEALVKSPAKQDVEKREKWKTDLDDARIMLRAADQVVFELEKKAKGPHKVTVKVVKEDTPPDNLEPEKP